MPIYAFTRGGVQQAGTGNLGTLSDVLGGGSGGVPTAPAFSEAVLKRRGRAKKLEAMKRRV